jgi:hypothetical protein
MILLPLQRLARPHCNGGLGNERRTPARKKSIDHPITIPDGAGTKTLATAFRTQSPPD